MDRRPMITTTHDGRIQQEFTAAVEAHVADLIDTRAMRWRGVPHADGLFAELRRACLGGGKRLRSTFCRWGYDGARHFGLVDDGVVRAGATLELLHTFALIHDDVMDGSARRRGAPTVHTMLAERHAVRGWRGERRRFAEGVAVVVGDLAFSLAQEQAGTLPTTAQEVWHQLCEELVVGQHLDLVATATEDREPTTATRMNLMKSARYTVVRPLQLGAALAGDQGELAAAYAAYGDPLGEAFQLRDDLLGVFGDPMTTGKPVDEDLRAGKPTMLLAFADRHATAADRAVLSRVGAADLTDAELVTIREILERCGARDAVERRITGKLRLALEALDEARLAAPVDEGLRRLAKRLAWRDR